MATRAWYSCRRDVAPRRITSVRTSASPKQVTCIPYSPCYRSPIFHLPSRKSFRAYFSSEWRSLKHEHCFFGSFPSPDSTRYGQRDIPIVCDSLFRSVGDIRHKEDPVALIFTQVVSGWQDIWACSPQKSSYLWGSVNGPHWLP